MLYFIVSRSFQMHSITMKMFDHTLNAAEKHIIFVLKFFCKRSPSHGVMIISPSTGQ